MTTATINGINLTFDEYGSGEPVILVAGSGSPGRVWKTHQVPALVEAGYRAITFDNRGTPDSDQCEQGFVIADMVADTVGLAEYLNIGSCRMIGQSLGALIIQELMLGNSELVKQAVLMATHGRSDPLRTAMTKAEIELLEGGVKIPERYEAVVRSIQNLSPSTLNNEMEIRDWLEVFEFSPLTPLSRSQLEACIIDNRLERYGDIKTPCLVISFEDDITVPPHLGREVADAIPGSEYHQIAESGHYGYLEQPEAVNTAITGFFARGAGAA
jgi:pimeloyl-ACP methyl ester carboxylesterase